MQKNYKSVISCLICNKTRQIWSYRLKNGRGKYCSKACFWKARKGVRVSQGTEFKKGNPYGRRIQKGERFSPETEFKKGQHSPHEWKKGVSIGGIGTKFAAYHQIHYWIRTNLGKPLVCWYCKTTDAKKYHWANKSGLYKRDWQDWIRLCARCHYYYDRDETKRQEIRKFIDNLLWQP